MPGNIQTLLSGRNWLCLILKQHNKGYISFHFHFKLIYCFWLLYFFSFLFSMSLFLPSVLACLAPSPLAPSFLPFLPYLPPSRFLHSLPTSHSRPHPSLFLFFTPSLHLTLSPTVHSYPESFHPSLLVSFLHSLPASHSLSNTALLP